MCPKKKILAFCSTRRSQTIVLRVTIVMVVLVLTSYAFMVTDVFEKSPSSGSWNVSMLVQNAIHQLQKAIMSPQIRERKLVLLWTDFFSEKNWLPTTEDLKCPVNDCDVTSDRSKLHRSSAVILHVRNVDTKGLPPRKSYENSHNPLWVMFNLEAPTHTPVHVLEKLQGKVHWTATYRRDSDLFAPYGRVVEKKGNGSEIPDFDLDRSLLCWLVSNCNTPSKREVFVKQLAHHIEVDIYGRCSNNTCPHSDKKNCYQWLSKRCKFYLSFENSNCRDYITEKLFYAMSSGMVPVVMSKSSNYENLPPHSFIDVANFVTPKDLAEYLVTVGNDKELYMSYLSWRKSYEVMDYYMFHWYCDLCEKLHSVDVSKVKPHEDLKDWWYGSACIS